MPAISPSRGEIAHSTACASHRRCRRGRAPKLPISPLEGEMPSRAEGVPRTTPLLKSTSPR
ncbi:MAG: propionyl-coenzyme A carboxylase alpha polypeptide [Mesorhizobium sp.]|nr:MAG: propionyl-coenzyme A carboxylase alpha polypeptide [Mesorhizobium sp.]